MTVCDNLGEHLIGNIYIKVRENINYRKIKVLISIQFRNERDAERAVTDLNTRWFDRKPIYAELRYEK